MQINSLIYDREAFSSLTALKKSMEGKKKSKSEEEKGNGGGRVTSAWSSSLSFTQWANVASTLSNT